MWRELGIGLDVRQCLFFSTYPCDMFMYVIQPSGQTVVQSLLLLVKWGWLQVSLKCMLLLTTGTRTIPGPVDPACCHKGCSDGGTLTVPLKRRGTAPTLLPSYMSPANCSLRWGLKHPCLQGGFCGKGHYDPDGSVHSQTDFGFTSWAVKQLRHSVLPCFFSDPSAICLHSKKNNCALLGSKEEELKDAFIAWQNDIVLLTILVTGGNKLWFSCCFQAKTDKIVRRRSSESYKVTPERKVLISSIEQKG